MSGLIADLFEFFGVAPVPPQNLGEFLPWFFEVLIALGLFLFVFRMLRAAVTAFSGGRML